MAKPFEITSAIQNIFDLWTSIEGPDEAFDRLPILSDGYRDAALDWEADFCQWLVINRRKPFFIGTLWGFIINNKVKLDYLTPKEVIAREFRRQRGEKILQKLPSHYLPHEFLSLGNSLVAETPAKCYWKSIAGFSQLLGLRQQVLDTDCLGS